MPRAGGQFPGTRRSGGGIHPTTGQIGPDLEPTDDRNLFIGQQEWATIALFTSANPPPAVKAKSYAPNRTQET